MQPEFSGIPWLAILTALPPIEIDVEFGERTVMFIDGKAVESGCVSSGLCSLHIGVGGNHTGDGNNMTTTGRMGYEEGILYMSISNTDLQNEGITQLDAATINLAASLTLEDEIAADLGLSVPYTIESGDYEVGTKDGRVFVKLN